MRFPATALLPAAFLALAACGMWWDDPPPPPPPFYTLEIACETCRESGVDTIHIHDASGERVLVLDGQGEVTTSSTGVSVHGGKTWFSTSTGPMVVDWASDSETTVWIDLVPADWGPDPLGDTVLFRSVSDLRPDGLDWAASFRVPGSYQVSAPISFDYRWSQELRIQPNEQGLFLLRVPKILFRPGPPRMGEFSMEYRGMAFFRTTFPETSSMPSWPPRLDSATRYSIWGQSWEERLEDGEVRSTTLHRDASGSWVFHRVLLNGKDRLWEDSGSWDSTRGFVHTLRRGPGRTPSVDSFAFRPLRVLGATNGVWWWDVSPFHGRKLEKAVQFSIRSPSWKFFARP